MTNSMANLTPHRFSHFQDIFLFVGKTKAESLLLISSFSKTPRAGRHTNRCATACCLDKYSTFERPWHERRVMPKSVSKPNFVDEIMVSPHVFGDFGWHGGTLRRAIRQRCETCNENRGPRVTRGLGGVRSRGGGVHFAAPRGGEEEGRKRFPDA